MLRGRLIRGSGDEFSSENPSHKPTPRTNPAFKIGRTLAGQENPIDLWNRDPEFSTLFDEIKNHTLVDRVRAFMIFQLARHVAHLPGDRRGWRLPRRHRPPLRAVVARKTVSAFDTFSGMPPTDQRDFHREGDFADTSYEAVNEYLKAVPNVKVFKGTFPESGTSVTNTQFSMVHIDVDSYPSIIACSEFLLPRVVSGGIILYDDYGQITVKGAKMAVDTFFAQRSLPTIYLPTGQCLVIKR